MGCLSDCIDNHKFCSLIDPPADEPHTNNTGFVTVEEGYAIEILCHISGGNPIASLHWKCDNRHVSGTNTINATMFLSELSLLAKPTYNGKSCYCYASHPLFAGKKVETVLIILCKYCVL